MISRPKPNFPANQKTGRLAEIWVDTYFTRQGWTTGGYKIDDGFDLFVTPPRSEFDGQCFLVQVKGQAKRQKGGVFAPVSRARLRDYARDVMPVLIFRVFLDDNSAYWTHAQQVVEENPRLAVGAGIAQVRMSHSASSFDEFLRVVKPILTPSHRRINGVQELITRRERYLSSLDETLDVTISANGNESTISITQNSHPASPAGVTLQVGDEEFLAIQEMTLYGESATISSQSLQFYGSPLYEELGLNIPQPGTLQLSPAHKKECKLRLCPAGTSLLGDELVLPGVLTFGRAGLTVQTTERATLNAKLRVSKSDNAVDVKLTMGLPESLFAEQISLNQSIGRIGQWAESLEASGRLSIEICASKQSLKFSAPTDHAKPLIEGLIILGKLHHIARITNSEYVLPDSLALTTKEAQKIDLAYRLFRGELVTIEVLSAFGRHSDAEKGNSLADHEIASEFSIVVGKTLVCKIPITINLYRYSVGPLDASGCFELTRSTESRSTASLRWQ
ncbi:MULTISPECIES: DUF4365 domain-containing protein [unclassified Stenotrophomonas]|uniref:DUF4365 domain-containing protein n=1 Tax=unclassified Stenotrophomonas TaxID=196198 RepID=UPI003F955822